MQIHKYLDSILEGNRGIAIMIAANHNCVALRGIKQNSTMKTSKLSGLFFDDEKTRNEYYEFISKII
jgi:GTP cyclohydrolase I